MKFSIKNIFGLSMFSMLLFGMGNAKLYAAAKSESNIIRIISFTSQSTLKLEVTFNHLPKSTAAYHLEIAADDSARNVLFNEDVSPSVILKEQNKIIFYLDNLHPELWNPTNPFLYQLKFLTKQHNHIEAKIERIGFRFFEAKNGHLYLNGHPIFLRGIAINPPERGIPHEIETSRKFALDYVKYMKSIHVNIIRIPDDTTWYNVCDELGMMVFGGNYSGSVDGQSPPKNYDKAVAWYENEKFVPIASHPSLMIYAITNERPFSGSEMIVWKNLLSYVHTQLKKWDSTRVYIGNAGYGYGQSGDICDLHRYWGWYYSSPFTFLHIRNTKEIVPIAKPAYQPITFTECVGNYTGPGGQYNLTPDHKNPGSQLNWTGHARWDVQAQLADAHQCFTFQHAAEYDRQLRDINPDLGGLFPFTILFHNWNTIKSFVDMDPKAVAQQAKISYQPILISWECFTPNVNAGSIIHPIAHVINDDDYFKDLNGASLVYQVQDKTNAVVTTDTIKLPLVKYYGTYKKDLAIHLPEILPIGNYDLIGKIIKGDSVLSKNYFNLFIAGKKFIQTTPAPERKIFLYDTKSATERAFNKLSIVATKINSFNSLDFNSVLIIGENSADNNLKNNATKIKSFIKAGGRVLSMRQDLAGIENLNSILNYQIEGINMDLDTPVYPPPSRPSTNGYNINPERTNNPIFSGIKRTNLIYWSDYTNWNESSKESFPAIYPVTNGFVLKDNNAIASTAILANYGPALDGIALAEMFDVKGSTLLCGLDLVRRAGLDPVADKLLKNMISYVASNKEHEKYILINSPIIWGGYASERGLITGINSGLLLNGKPRLAGSLDKIPLVIAKKGYEFAGHPGGFNDKPGIQYIPYGRRPFGPYHLRGFGDVPFPDNDNNNIGKGMFWCRIPVGKTKVSTIVWNPSKEVLSMTITVNNEKITQEISAGDKATIACPVNATDVRMTFSGDRRLVLLQTSFE